MSHVEVKQGDSPLVLGFPHTGTWLPEDAFATLNETGKTLADTDWHVHRLYDGLVQGVTTLRSNVHRYVIDANRDPSDQSLYAGQNTTSLCPVTNFDGEPIYRDGQQPNAGEISARRKLFHQPYHDALEEELARVRKRHGFAILYDCHSIRAHIPFLFDGVLPDFNIGTNSGSSCDDTITDIVMGVCRSAPGYSSILNGRFKGGWTTRHYGRPGEGIHAIQMELAQRTHIREAPPWDYLEAEAAKLRPHLKSILQSLIEWRPA